ncbi:Lrp/AsnC family transcriptional regulator [Ruania alba]|uniref:DNA-binding transcriptional regulator, Lrp family n=1 Tax=Ruania alba TaxID=648782 RepID=A0A1H5NGP5_9MICO|nr:Lrp/AsnC family transcriptional regulator [Ruania alba]SEF00745.1 DNA-binding transcriptional regulator, Lrp family [Ruania alba]
MGAKNVGMAGRSAGQVDEIGYRILEVLRDNGRISIAALAQQVGISRASAYARVEALTQAGVIMGYTARVDPARAGLGICALVFVTVHPQTWPDFLDAIREMPDIESAKITTGEHDVMLLIRGADVDVIHGFVVGVIAALPQVKSVETVLVLDEVFDRGYLLPTDVSGRGQAVAERGLMRYTRTNPDRPSRID